MIELMCPENHPLVTPQLESWLAERLERLCDVCGLPPSAEATVALMDDAEIRELNAEWRQIDEPTDVLSFAMQEAEDAAITPDLLGDIAISVETAARMVASGEHRARVCEELGREIEWGLREELLFLSVHGFLHLLGYDHADADEEIEMKAKEREVFFALVAIG